MSMGPHLGYSPSQGHRSPTGIIRSANRSVVPPRRASTERMIGRQNDGPTYSHRQRTSESDIRREELMWSRKIREFCNCRLDRGARISERSAKGPARNSEFCNLKSPCTEERKIQTFAAQRLSGDGPGRADSNTRGNCGNTQIMRALAATLWPKRPGERVLNNRP
jgi:hypothetical protein